MVYSVFYYASEAITRAIVSVILKIAELTQRKSMIREKPPEEKMPPPWGFFATTNPYGVKEYTWVGMSTGLKVSIPALISLPIKGYEVGRQPSRLYFTFSEAASKEWFKEIEWLAEQAEKQKKPEK